MKNSKLIMTSIDKDDLFDEAMDEFFSYKLYLMQLKANGDDPEFAVVLAETARKFANPEFAQRMKNLLHTAAELQAAMLK